MIIVNVLLLLKGISFNTKQVFATPPYRKYNFIWQLLQTNRQENDTRNTFVYAVKASVYKKK